MILKNYLEEKNITLKECADEIEYCLEYVRKAANFIICPGKKFKRILYKYTKKEVTHNEWLSEESHKKLNDERKKQKIYMDKLKKELFKESISVKDI